MNEILYYAAGVLALVGAASVAAAGSRKLAELVEATETRYDNIALRGVKKFASVFTKYLKPVLDKLALNPPQK